MIITFIIFIFLFGLCIGSFLNVVAYRIPKNKSIVKPGSFCPNCKKPIKWYGNIPIISYLVLRGKCVNCGWKIPVKYPIVELITGLLFLACYLVFGLSFKLLSALILVSILVAISIVDFELQIIPDKLILFGLETGFVLWFASMTTKITGSMRINAIPMINNGSFIMKGLWPWIGLFSGAATVIAIAVVSQWFLKAETMGGGDIKMAALIGFFLGPYVFLVLGLSFVVGAFVTVPMLFIGKIKSRKQQVPFGPFIAVATLIVMFFGPAIWKWYAGFLV